jgi:hypothetical protein
MEYSNAANRAATRSLRDYPLYTHVQRIPPGVV